MSKLFDQPASSGATFSPCRRYRYTLWRDWGHGQRCAFIGLNPSTADETVNDPTVRRCINFAKAWGYSGMWMLNAYAWRSTDPLGLLDANDPIGPGNDDAIATAASAAEIVVCCWGNHCISDRQQRIVDLLQPLSDRAKCLGRNANGTPKHPLYLAGDTRPEKFP